MLLLLQPAVDGRIINNIDNDDDNNNDSAADRSLIKTQFAFYFKSAKLALIS